MESLTGGERCVVRRRRSAHVAESASASAHRAFSEASAAWRRSIHPSEGSGGGVIFSVARRENVTPGVKGVCANRRPGSVTFMVRGGALPSPGMDLTWTRTGCPEAGRPAPMGRRSESSNRPDKRDSPRPARVTKTPLRALEGRSTRPR
ncbi:hypothetical protein CCP2SC5_410004 [Azospirillaceae bacterium]